jgi:peptidoglycan hydrolase-like protein with peptidoglycan-binding domain
MTTWTNIRRFGLVALLALPAFAALPGCHAHQVQAKQTTLETPPKEPQVSSERPVRTTPGGMLDPVAMRKVQSALSKHGVSAPSSGQLDEETQAALRKFQAKEQIAKTGMPDYDTLRRLGLDPKTIYLGGTARASSKKQ